MNNQFDCFRYITNFNNNNNNSCNFTDNFNNINNNNTQHHNTTSKPGHRGPQGPQGAVGPAGSILGYADFYAIIPPDNASTITPGAGGTEPVSAHLTILRLE